MLEREGQLFSTRNGSLTLLLLLLLFEIDLGRIWMRLLDCASSSRSDYRFSFSRSVDVVRSGLRMLQDLDTRIVFRPLS